MGYALEAFMDHLMQEEYTENTLSKYRRDLSRSLEYQGGQPMTEELGLRYKKSLLLHYRAASVNSMLAAVNHYLEYAGYSACKVHTVRIQKKIYTEDDRILTRKEYARLLQSCSDPRTQLIMEILCSTGIRVSELHYITVENYRKKDDQGIQQGKRTCGIFAGSADCPPASLCKKEEDHQWGDLHQQDRKALGSYRNLADDETLVRKGRSRPEKSVPA